MKEVERGPRRSRRRRTPSPPYRQGLPEGRFEPVDPEFGDDAGDVLVLVGLILSATAFFVEFVALRLSLRLTKA